MRMKPPSSPKKTNPIQTQSNPISKGIPYCSVAEIICSPMESLRTAGLAFFVVAIGVIGHALLPSIILSFGCGHWPPIAYICCRNYGEIANPHKQNLRSAEAHSKICHRVIGFVLALYWVCIGFVFTHLQSRLFS